MTHYDIIALVSMISLNLFAVYIIAYYIYKLINKSITVKTFFVFLFWALNIILMATSMIWHYPISRYSPLHLLSVSFFIYTGFILLYFKKYSRTIAWTFSVLFLVMNLIKIPYHWLYGHSWYSLLPLQICGISGLLIILRPFYTRNMTSERRKNWAQRLDNYILCLGILGAVLNVPLSDVHTFGDFSYFRLWTFEANVMHWLFFTYVIYMFLAKEIKANRKLAFSNLYWIVPMYILLIYPNAAFDGWFFYTHSERNPIAFLFNLFNYSVWEIGSVSVQINPLYWLTVILLSGIFLFLTASLFELLDRKFLTQSDIVKGQKEKPLDEQEVTQANYKDSELLVNNNTV